MKIKPYSDYIITNKLKVLRTKMAISQEETARRIGMSKMAYGSIENNKSEPSLRNAFLLSHVLAEGDITKVFSFRKIRN